jgi:RNA polymerase sigma-70 factor (ECF subfamily)
METEDGLHLNGMSAIDLDKNLFAAIETLKNEQQQCVKLYFFEKKSYEEIQEQTGFTYNEVKSHLQNGKRNLRLQLTKGHE